MEQRMHRRVEITVEREVVSFLGPADHGFPATCPECGREVTMLTPEDAARGAATTARNVYRWVEEKLVHFVESSTGKLFVCAESVNAMGRSKQISSGEPR
jgi:hypothetical protein